MSYRFVRTVMGMSDSSGFSRLVLKKLSEKFDDEFPFVKGIIECDTCKDNSSSLGSPEDDFINK